MRKVWICILALTLALLPLAHAAGDGNPAGDIQQTEQPEGTFRETNGETGYTLVIEDAAGLLQPGETEKVAEAMRGVTLYAHVGFLTVPAGNGGMNPATRAQQWGDRTFGSGNRFTVFSIDMGTRHLDIYASRPLSGELKASEENTITDNVSKLATGGAYGDCAVKAFTQIGEVLSGNKIPAPMKYASNAFIALIAAMLAAYLLISAWIRKEQAVTMPDVVRAAGIGAATVITANTLKRVVHHESSGGGRSGGFGGGGHGGGGGSSGGHGF